MNEGELKPDFRQNDPSDERNTNIGGGDGGDRIIIERRLTTLETKIDNLVTKEDFKGMKIWILCGVITAILGSPLLLFYILRVIQAIKIPG